ncbi:insulinase family protein [bacterium]|nr:insulinase family protein [bacterium]
MKINSLFAILLLAGITTASAGDKSEAVTLPNGMTAILHSFPHTNVTCVALFARAGSICETDSTAGITRFMEKSLFRMTGSRRDVRAELDSYGGDFQSGVNQDFAVFAVTASGAFLFPILDLFNDVVRDARFNDSLAADVRLELTRRLEEERKNPDVQILSRYLSLAFREHPYRFMPHGSAEGFRVLTAADVRRHFEMAFVPRNLVLVVTGQFERAGLIDRLKNGIGRFERESRAFSAWRPESRHAAAVDVRERHGFGPNVAFVTVGWPAPAVSDPATVAMDVLVTALGNGQSSRLNRQIRVSAPSLYSVWSEYRTPRDPGFIRITAACPPADADSVRSAILREVRILQDDLMPEPEMARAKRMLAATESFSREGATDYANYIGYWATMADLDLARQYVRRIRAVRQEDVRNTVRTFMTDEQRVSIILMPE